MSGTRLVARLAAFATAVALMTITTVSPPPAAAVTPTCATANITVTGLGGPNFYIDGGNAKEFRSGYTGYRITNATGAAVDDLWVSLSGFTGGSLALASGQSAAQRAGSLTSGGAEALFWYLTASGENLTTAQGHTITVHHHNPALPNSSALCTTTGGFAAVEGTITAGANKIDGITVSGGTPTLGSTFTVTVTGDTGQIGSGTTVDPESLWMTPAVTEAWPADAFRLVSTALTMSPDGTAAQQTYTDTLRVANLGAKARPYTAAYTFQAVGFTATPTPVRPVQEIASGTQVKHTSTYPTSIPAIAQPVNDLTVGLTSSAARLDSDGGSVTFTSTVSGTVGASLDSFVLTPPAGTLPVASSVSWAGVAAQDPVWRNGTLVFPGPFTVPATGAQLRFTVTVDGDAGAQAFSLLGTVGPSFIGRTVTPVDGSNPATASVTVDTDPVAGAISVLVDQDVPKTISLSGHVSDADNDTITLTSAQGAAHGTVSPVAGAILYTPAVGYTGPDSFTYTVSDGRGGTATATVTVTVAAVSPPPSPTAQAITFPQPGDLTTGAAATLTATSDSGLPVTLASQTTDVCIVASGVVTAVAAGTCTITATQAGNATYAAASPVSHSLTVTNPPVEPDPPTAQAITFAQPSDLVTGDTATITATASSNLTVTLTSQTPGVCTITNGVVTAVAAGTCTVDATQAGNSIFAAATPVSRSLTVTNPPVEPDPPTAQAITFNQPSDLTTGDTATITATASSNLTVTLTSQTPGVCTITNGVVTAVTAGTCTIDATQAGNATYAAAAPVTRTLTVKDPQTIAFAQPDDLITGDTSSLSATSDSGLSATLASQTTSICTVAGGVVSAVSAGTCTIRATQPGNATYAAASPVTRTLTIKDPQTITFAQPDDLVSGDTASLNATTSSNLAVSLSSQTAAVCTVAGGVVTAVSAGTCTIRATQAGNATYAAATPVTRSLAVTDTQVITFHAAAQVLTGPPPLHLTASSSSGLPVSLTLVAGSCTLHGQLLVADRDTTCTVEATQAGDALVAPAAPVRQQISFVSPQDDAFTMESQFVGPDHVDMRPLANDPSGLAITSVGQPTHGTVSLGDDGVAHYAPYPTFHGADSFTYAVADGDGRSATAVVRVTVANAAPVVTAKRVRQLAGTTISVPMSATDPNEDALVLTAESQDAGVGVAVDGTDLTISAGRRITGWVAVHVDVTDAFGATGSMRVRDLVSPMPVDSASRTIAAEGTRVRWSRADADDARYEVLVDGQTACTTRTLSCDLDRVLGPLFRVQVRVLGHDGTTSTRTDARPEGHQQVLIATVYFDSGRWQLGDAQTRELASVARKITRMRFPLAQVSGYTDSDGGAAYNLRLSRQRTRTVSAYLRGHAAITSREAWFGYDDPVAENTSAAGRARNRRVEILVRY